MYCIVSFVLKISVFNLYFIKTSSLLVNFYFDRCVFLLKRQKTITLLIEKNIFYNNKISFYIFPLKNFSHFVERNILHKKVVVRRLSF